MRKFEGWLGNNPLYSDDNIPDYCGGILYPRNANSVWVKRSLLEDIYKELPNKECQEAKEIKRILSD